MAFSHYIYSGTKRLRCGYTTGTSAALAAGVAAEMLLGGQVRHTAGMETPSGILVETDILSPEFSNEYAKCAVAKDGGDDIDATDGLMICAEVCRSDGAGVVITGGPGVGCVTKPGLDQPVGEAAINMVPREMIASQVGKVCKAHGYKGGISVTISVPGGEEAAEKTFNPNLGIEGGISILGTSGIVEPRSVAALVDSIELEIRQRAAQGERGLILTPGNYGEAFIQIHPQLLGRQPVSCANFIGDALDFAARYDFEKVLLVGHVGKLVKVAGGIMNTHSRMADCRTELFCAHAALQGADARTARAIMEAATADACMDILKEQGILEPVLDSLIKAIDGNLKRRVSGAYKIGAILFSNQYGDLGQTGNAELLLSEFSIKKMEDRQ